MVFFGKRVVFCVLMVIFMLTLGSGMTILNSQYDVVKMSDGPQAALAMAFIGLGVLFLTQIVMALVFFLRIRNAGRSAWWLLPAVVPFVGIPVFVLGLFWKERYY